MSLLSDILIPLAEADGVSGNEADVLVTWGALMDSYVDDLSKSVMGNLVGRKTGKVDNKIMLTAHADEIGFIITNIDENGFVYFDEVGGVDTELLPARVVSIKGKTGKVLGVIGVKPIHLQRGQRTKDHNISAKDLWIDIGAENKEDAEKWVEIGDYVTVVGFLRKHETHISYKALDNRCGLAVLVGVAQKLSSLTIEPSVFYVAATQEEIGARGARTSAYEIVPDICIVIDVTHATDYPSVAASNRPTIKLGHGPVVAVGPNMDHLLVDKLKTVAKNHSIGLQIEALAMPTGTDANPIQITQSGIRTLLISIPCRYMHTSIETVDIRDIENTVKLIAEFLKEHPI